MNNDWGRSDRIASGASYPADPIASLPVATMGSITRVRSSSEYPKQASMRP